MQSYYQSFMQHQHLLESLLSLPEPKVLEPYLYLWQRSGKKLRIMLAILIEQLFEDQTRPEIVQIGGLIEMLHCASLIVDDVEDSSRQRRGQPCAHLVYGLDSALNAANLAYFLPVRKFIKSLPGGIQWPIAEIFLEEMTECHVGQGLDVHTHRATSEEQLPSREEYFRITALKTGGLLRMLVRMVAVVLAIPEPALQELLTCMSHIGIAYQIADDMLNLCRTDSLGKGTIAEDLHERKYTLAVDALRKHPQFMSLYFTAQKSPAVIARMLDIIEEKAVVEQCLGEAQRQSELAMAAAERLQCPRSKEALRLFIGFVVERRK